MKLKNRLNQISRLLTKEEKISGFKLLLCIILMGVLDVLGVASILPFMSLASDPNFLESNELLLDVYNYLEFNSYTSFFTRSNSRFTWNSTVSCFCIRCVRCITNVKRN